MTRVYVGDFRRSVIVRIIPFAVLKAQKFMKVPLSGYNAFG